MKELKITAEISQGHPTAHLTIWPDVDTLLIVSPFSRPSLEYRSFMADLEKVRSLLDNMRVIRADTVRPTMISFDLDPLKRF